MNTKPKKLSRQITLCIVTLVILVSSLVLSACQDLFKTPEPITIVFSFPKYDQAQYEIIAQEYMKANKNITIKLEPSINDRLNEEADVQVVNWQTTLDQNNTDLGKMLALDPYISRDKNFNASDFYAGGVNAFRVNGKVMAIPFGLDPFVMYYNKDLFDRYGVAYPTAGWTWDDFLSKAQAITHPEDSVFGYTTLNDYIDGMFFVYQHGGKMVDSNGQPTFDDPLTISALDWYAALFYEHNVAPTYDQANSAFGAGNDSFYVGVLRGKIGMWEGQLSQRGGTYNFPVKWEMNWALAPLPRDATAFTGSTFEGYAISADTKAPDACWNWVVYLSQQVTTRLMPSRRSIAESKQYEEKVGPELAQAARASMENAALASPESFGQFGMIYMMDFFGAVEKIVKGETTPREAMLALQQQALQKTP